MTKEDVFTREDATLLFANVSLQVSSYRKKIITRALPITGPFDVQTREGVMHCDDGWLAIDNNGDPYPIASDVFDASYEPA